MIRPLVSLAAATVLAALPVRAAMTPIAGDPIRIDGGRVSGTRLASGVRAYLGIPFAQPPVGMLRWAPPKPVRWDGIWNADRKGAECIQVLRPHDINHYFGEEPSSEDCLTLNLWTPAGARPGARLPVIVFIYGGGFTIGSSGMPNYGGENVARAGAVFVNFNYRVGAFGFLAHPELSAEQGGHSGNYALMDQAAALRWVRANIARFGGDPEKVLIVGQSAGARSVALHLFSPQSRGLFRAAAMSSGCGFAGGGVLGAPMPTLRDAEQVGLALQKRLGAANLDALRQIPADRILAVQSESQVGAHVEGIRIPGAIVDGFVIPRSDEAMLAAGEIARVPIIASYNGDDIDAAGNPLASARTVDAYTQAARSLYGPAAKDFLALFPVASDADVVANGKRIATMIGFENASRQCARAMTRLGAAGYIDEFTRKHPYVPGVRIADQDIATVGAYHTADIPYWFDTLDTYNSLRATRAWTPADRDLSARMLGALIAFAATGNPGTAKMPWPAWTPVNDAKLDLDLPPRLVPLDGRRLDWLARHPAILPRRGALPSRPRD